MYLYGDVPAEQRKTIIERFRQDDSLRIFLSTDAGGVGVNLQRANILVNLDLPWNPAVLEQWIGRIYRLGQKRKVQVFNFISAYSIEHRIQSGTWSMWTLTGEIKLFRHTPATGKTITWLQK